MEAGGDAGFRGGDLEDEDGAGEVRKISIQLTLQIKVGAFFPIIPPGSRTSPNFVVFFLHMIFFFLVCIGVSLLNSSGQKEGSQRIRNQQTRAGSALGFMG